MLRIPVTFDAEYRGVAPAGEFKDDSGELVEFSEKLKFEVELPNGDVAIVPVGIQALDKCIPPIDGLALVKGDRVTFTGMVGGDGAYFRPHAAEVQGSAAKAKIAA